MSKDDAYSTGRLLAASLNHLEIAQLLCGLCETKKAEAAIKEWVQKNFEYNPEDNEITWG